MECEVKKVSIYTKTKLNNLERLDKRQGTKTCLGVNKTIVKDWGGDYKTMEEFCNQISFQVCLSFLLPL